MITFSKLGKFGRCGNSLFQVAFLNSLADKYGVDWCIPEWKYAKYFEEDFLIKNVQPAAVLKEGPYKYQPDIFKGHGNLFDRHVVDIEGYFQHKEYWNAADTKELFRFKPEFIESIRARHKDLLTQPFTAVGVRRGDYVGNGNYYPLPVTWYLNALDEFPDHKFIFFSDDIEWCKFHFGSIPNAVFPHFDSDIECLAFGTFAENWIIANSTFHWWSAFLSNAKRIIQPTKYFAGDLLKREGDENFYNKEWEFSDFEKVDLTDVTFTIPVKYDHPDRQRNLELILHMLKKDFDTNIVVGEQGGDHFKYVEKFGVQYKKFDLEFFHRTKMLNVMAVEADTDIVVNWDADVMTPAAQIYEAVKCLRGRQKESPKPEVVYPYDNIFQRIPKQLFKQIYPDFDLANFRNIQITKQDTKSVGGAVFYDREAFLRAGGENENFRSYGKEDQERWHRFRKLGLRVERVPGNIYHFNHHCGPDSNKTNPFYADNDAEFERICFTGKDILLQEIEEWKQKRGY